MVWWEIDLAAAAAASCGELAARAGRRCARPTSEKLVAALLVFLRLGGEKDNCAKKPSLRGDLPLGGAPKKKPQRLGRDGLHDGLLDHGQRPRRRAEDLLQLVCGDARGDS